VLAPRLSLSSLTGARADSPRAVASVSSGGVLDDWSRLLELGRKRAAGAQASGAVRDSLLSVGSGSTAVSGSPAADAVSTAGKGLEALAPVGEVVAGGAEVGAESDAEEDCDDSGVAPLAWLDADGRPGVASRMLHEKEVPAAPPRVASAASKPGTRPTAVKSMPFRPPKLLPTDLILSSPVPAAVGGADLRAAGPPPKRARTASSKDLPGPPRLEMSSQGTGLAQKHKAAVDEESRPYDLQHVVVNFASVGASFVRAMRGSDPTKDYRIFDWEGVRQCVSYLKFHLGLKVIGVMLEKLLAPDLGSKQRSSLPADIRTMCESVEVAEGLAGLNARRAGSVWTVMNAHRRNCRFISDDLGARMQQLCDEECRGWLLRCRRLLLMRYFFSREHGIFESPDGDYLPDLPVSASR